MPWVQNSKMASKTRELFQRFQVQKFLGKGSYGSVYRVKRLTDDQVYAVKEADVTKMSQQERQDAANEIRLLASIKHPNVIRYYEAFLDGNWLCIIMEFASHGDLSHYIKKGRERKTAFPEEIIWSFFIQILCGIESLHARKVLHRDIKPMNIFIGKGDIVKVGDLGIAKMLKNNAAAQTQIGTPHYMAPEIWKGRPYTFGADVWSLGCLLYEMMTYRVPFEAKSMNELRAKVMAGRCPPLTGNYSSDLNNLCMSMMEVDPAKRPSIGALLQLPAIRSRLPSLPTANAAGVVPTAAPMVNTIVVPRNLKQLNEKLPAASYDLEDDRIGAAR